MRHLVTVPDSRFHVFTVPAYTAKGAAPIELEPGSCPVPAAPPSAMAESADTTDLASLLWLVGAGDQHAFQRLFDQESPRLYAVALRITDGEDLAQEVLNTVLMQIWRRAISYQPHVGTPQAWLVAHVRARAIELVRRRQRAGAPTELYGRNADMANGLARLSATTPGAHMRTALAKLDDSGPEIIVLAFLDGLSLGEIAQKLRLPIGTVKAWTSRSLGTIRLALERPA